jgi:suppressor for copper-sensitivity B
MLVLAQIAAPAVSDAATGDWAINDHGRVWLLSGGATADGGVLLGLQFRMEPGWKIYWRSPGDAGYPPSVDWSASSNLEDASLEWPVPQRFSLFGLETFGYEGEVIFPIEARLKEMGRDLTLNAKVDYLTCSDICVPYSESVTLDVASSALQASDDLAIINHFRDKVPLPIGESDIDLVSAYLEGTLERPDLLVRVASSTPFLSPDILVEGPPEISFGKPDVAVSDGGRDLIFRLPVVASKETGVLEGKRLVLTVTDGSRGAEAVQIMRYADPSTAMPEALTGAHSGKGLLAILGLALLGGLILNLMPCVLPVLSLKLLAVIKQGGRSGRAIRVGFLASAAGILFSFLVLATGALAIKSAGHAVGWGIQFQQPIFLILMALMITAFAANLFGLFEIPLPAGMATRLSEAGGQGVAGSFVTGAFATLLATPCSAPFLGTAVGFALARGAAEIYLVFICLGIGLALPYLLVAAFPQVAGRLPRPGPWMVYLRKLLGLALLATALWLLTVLMAQVGYRASVIAGAGLAAMWIVLWARHRISNARVREAVTLVVVATVLLTVSLPLMFRAPSGSISDGMDGWVSLDVPAIHRLVAEGRTVFVDVTADWCITCKVNKRLVLDDPVVTERLSATATALQRGDWTLPSDDISDYLAQFERYGIPFNAVYGPGEPQGILLPEILSVDSVLEALNRAGGHTVN